MSLLSKVDSFWVQGVQSPKRHISKPGGFQNLTQAEKLEIVMCKMDQNLCKYIANCLELRDFLVSKSKRNTYPVEIQYKIVNFCKYISDAPKGSKPICKNKLKFKSALIPNVMAQSVFYYISENIFSETIDVKDRAEKCDG